MDSVHHHQRCHGDDHDDHHDHDDHDDAHNDDVQARFASSEESSACSSVLSSLESVESNTSEGGSDILHAVIITNEGGSIISKNTNSILPYCVLLYICNFGICHETTGKCKYKIMKIRIS